MLRHDSSYLIKLLRSPRKTRNKISDEEKIVEKKKIYKRHVFYFCCNSKNLKRKEFKIS